MISEQEEWREPRTGTMLGGAAEGFVKDKGLVHTHTLASNNMENDAH